MIELAAGEWRAKLRPEIGGALASLSLDGLPILRSMNPGAGHPLQSSSFPLVPYCNRIARGRFAWAGQGHEIAPNHPPQPHPLHGTGWLRPWRIVRHDAASALLEDDYEGEGNWPWPYRAHQHVALDATGVTVRLIVENRAAEPVPLGLGLHPYFRRSPDSKVTFGAQAMLGIDGEFLPDGSALPHHQFARWSEGAALPDCLVDHCFTGWQGTALIEDEDGTIALRGFGAPHCHVFAPPGGDELCIEPVSHTPDALNRDPASLALVPPGAAAGIAIRIEGTKAH